MPGPIVETGDRVTLRTVEREDAAFLQRSNTDPRIRWYLGSIHHGNRAEQEDGIENWIESESTAAYLACLDGAADRGASTEADKGGSEAADKAASEAADERASETADSGDGENGPGAPYGHPDEGETTPIGCVTARHVDGDRPWLAYWLVPEFHGEGYGKEMVALAVDALFRTYAVRGVSAGAYGFNEASRGLLESLGFTEEVRRRESRYIDGAYRDEYQYGVLREEWDARYGDA